MKITILYFASIRETLGVDRESLDLPPGVLTVSDLRRWLRERGAVWSEALAEGRAVRVAVDRRLADPNALLSDGVELAFFPPVTGG